MKFKTIYALCGIAMMLATVSCDKTESYSELLRDEERAVNWYLSGFSIETEIPADSVFIVGEDAPFYKMDEDGHVYMKVLDPGDPDSRPQSGDKVYFRSSSMNLKNYYEAGYELWTGNSADLGTGSEPTSFVFNNYQYTTTSQYGTGVQEPLKYLGYDSRVMLVVKSPAGYPALQTQCLPYVMDIRYFKGRY